MPPRSRDDLRRLHFINALFAHATGQDLYLAEQIKSAISFNLAEFEARIAAFPWASKTYDAMFNAAAASLLVSHRHEPVFQMYSVHPIHPPATRTEPQ